jgi:hypothetical protein
MFHNAQEFVALYPDDKALSFQFCAPRIKEGSPELDPDQNAFSVWRKSVGPHNRILADWPSWCTITVLQTSA